MCFENSEEARRACQKDRETFSEKWGERYVRVYPTLESDVGDMQQAVAQQNMVHTSVSAARLALPAGGRGRKGGRGSAGFLHTWLDTWGRRRPPDCSSARTCSGSHPPSQQRPPHPLPISSKPPTPRAATTTWTAS